MPDDNFEEFIKKLKDKAIEEEKDKKKRLAVALGYDRVKDHAPKVLATGKGTVAEQIIAIAEAKGIPVHEDANLVELLTKLDLNSFIPIEAYVTVAEILSYIYKVNAQAKK